MINIKPRYKIKLSEKQIGYATEVYLLLLEDKRNICLFSSDVVLGNPIFCAERCGRMFPESQKNFKADRDFQCPCYMPISRAERVTAVQELLIFNKVGRKKCFCYSKKLKEAFDVI